MCGFEMYFPPLFFSIVSHLIIQLLHEIQFCRLIHLRYMYIFERVMGLLKWIVMNFARLEVSIAQ